MAVGLNGSTAPIEKIEVSAYTIPTDGPEADGTYAWRETTIVMVEAQAGGMTGLGYTYANAATARLIQESLAKAVEGCDALSVEAAWWDMVGMVRNIGQPGVAAMAISGVDNALWDLKARLLGLPLVTLLGAVRDGVPVYGSGGFTTYSDERLRDQLGGWAASGITRVKMKIGTQPDRDLARVQVARRAIGPSTQLFVDANGAYTRKQALAFAEQFAELEVEWFEEPVPSDDLEGLRLLRDRAPAGIDIAAGEYGYTLGYFRRMLEAGAVDVLQADATRCCGITGFVRAATLCEARLLPLSAHCAPTLHAHPCCALHPVCHVEYFYDHARIEHMLFDGAAAPLEGRLHPDRSRPGLGIELKREDAEQWRIGF
jgi:L-alanine-DL-glutamate epimerase-like enolase superfamily enzyme